MPLLIQSWLNRWQLKRPVWFAGLYVTFSCVWIFVTDRLIGHFSLTVAALTYLSIVKGFVYVAVTSSLIYAILRRLEKVNQNLENVIASRTAALAASEQESRTREEWLRRLLASLPDVAWTSTEEGRTVFISPNVEDIIGFSAKEICESGKGVGRERIHPQDRRRVDEGLQALFLRGQPFDEEYRVEHKDGRWIWVYDRAVRTHRVDGVLFADGIFSDITARKEADEARAESDKRYRLLFERNLAGVFRAEAGGKVLDCNPALVRMLGYDSAAELLGRASAEMLYDPAKENVLLETLATSGAINNVEIQLRRKDGTAMWGLHNVCLLERANGGPACIEGTVVDVSERKQTAEALSQQLSLMQAITSAAPDCLFTLDVRGRVTFMNPAAERIFGYALGELQGKVLHDVCHYKCKDGTPLARSECVIARACASGETLYGHEDVAFRKDDSAFDVLCSSAPLFEDGKIVGSVLVVQDITRRKMAEQQYQSLQEQFLHAQKMDAIGQLAGGVAHDFNNLLQIINGYSDLIVEDGGSDPQLTKRARAIKEAGGRAARLTQRLLDFSRKGASDPRISSLDRAVNEIMKMVRTLVAENIDLTARMDTNGECVKISEGQLEQLIMNLVVNARDAMPKGGRLHIETRCVNLDERACRGFGNLSPGAYVRLSVSDSGCGMDASTISRAFEPFFTTKERGKGTGLGLSTVYGIVNQNGGEIQIESTLGAGTTFHICLPVAESRVFFEEVKERLALPKGTENILVAEDEEDVRSLISGQLGRLGYKMMEAGDGVEALRLAVDAPRSIDLLITDMIMPKMGGQELSDRIREIWPTIKIINMSGYNDTPQPPSNERCPTIQHLQKPFTLETLAATVRRVLDQ